jgi:hypothetical protein
MNEDHRELLRDLRALAGDGPTEAPAALRERLLVEFRRRSRRRRRMAWLPVASVGAIAAAVVLLVWMPNQLRHSPAQAAIEANSALPVAATDQTESGFYPLPEAEGLPPIESATVVRVQMPLTSLQLMGLAVNDEGAADPVQAEILLGQDGLARGVRLVQ